MYSNRQKYFLNLEVCLNNAIFILLQVQLPRGSLLIGYVHTAHAQPAQDGKDVQTNNTIILDKGRCRKSHYPCLPIGIAKSKHG